jgi:hypothetical protein
MPSEKELPPGTVRDFVAFLFWLYRQAHRPALREISEAISRRDLPGTASPETVRRMLRGTTVPAHWETVEAVYLILCDLGGQGPSNKVRWEDDDEARTIRRHVEDRWHAALDNPDYFYETVPARGLAEDPWTADPSDGFGGDSLPDEPPF